MARHHPWAGHKSKDPAKAPIPVPPRPERYIEIGKVFGRLTCISETDEAEVWLFRCRCGKRVTTTARHLRDGKRSCGCLRREMSAAKVVDMTGQTWHDLTVLDRAGSDENGAALWRCRCACGFVGVYMGVAMRSGDIKSCGCGRTQVVDMAGQTWHDLTVLDRAGSNENGVALWRCRCQCGSVEVYSGAALRSGEIKSCGCRRTTRHKTLLGATFGSRTVMGQVQGTNKDRVWIWSCSCGKTGRGRADQIRNRKLCMCQRRE